MYYYVEDLAQADGWRTDGLRPADTEHDALWWCAT